jgi:hypothetical protein
VCTVEALLHGNYSTTDNNIKLTPWHRVFLEKCKSLNRLKNSILRSTAYSV